jgi:mannose-6-phosphate isomerase class I
MPAHDYLTPAGLRRPNYDKTPVVPVAGHDADCRCSWPAIMQTLREAAGSASKKTVIAIECYPGVFEQEIIAAIREHLSPRQIFFSTEAFLPPEEIDRLVAPELGGDDPIFGVMTRLTLDRFFDTEKQAALRRRVDEIPDGITVIMGTGALLCSTPDLIVYADMARWEAQLRQRRNEVSNLGVENKKLKASLQYKRSFFIDWRVCDKLKQATLATWDFLLDTCVPGNPKLITGDALRDGLKQAARQPFRVVPFFDPGPWGGQWMKQICDLPDGPPNYAWCFDCVPEENSLLLGFGETSVEIPSINLVFNQPQSLLGEAVYGRFGAEFPIRFDFLDTMDGGNLSFQVHPLTEYVQKHFGLNYTQDESYYILEAAEDTVVYLGCKNGTVPEEMIADLEAAQTGKKSFDSHKFAASFPAKKHDHFLIPAGTLHCSGRNAMVLEISATPYIFTFKLWDWNRLGLDGLPRPVNIERGKAVIQWNRNEDYARKRLVNQIAKIACGEGWVEERTGLHEAEFIETRRHWFSVPVMHKRTGSVEVLNLIEGKAAMVESPSGTFAPYIVHYAETFILPSDAGDYIIRPSTPGARCGTIKAFVRI